MTHVCPTSLLWLLKGPEPVSVHTCMCKTICPLVCLIDSMPKVDVVCSKLN